MVAINGGDSASPPQRNLHKYSNATQSIHADDYLAPTHDIAPAMHVSTTFRYSSNPTELIPVYEDEVRQDYADQVQLALL